MVLGVGGGSRGDVMTVRLTYVSIRTYNLIIDLIFNHVNTTNGETMLV